MNLLYLDNHYNKQKNFQTKIGIFPNPNLCEKRLLDAFCNVNWFLQNAGMQIVFVIK